MMCIGRKENEISSLFSFFFDLVFWFFFSFSKKKRTFFPCNITASSQKKKKKKKKSNHFQFYSVLSFFWNEMDSGKREEKLLERWKQFKELTAVAAAAVSDAVGCTRTTAIIVACSFFLHFRRRKFFPHTWRISGNKNCINRPYILTYSGIILTGRFRIWKNIFKKYHLHLQVT